MCCVRKVNEMRWLSVIGVLLYLTRCNDAGALKCHPGSQDPLCELEKKEISSIENLIERDIAIPSDEAQCLPGSEWESNCHRCHCSQSGFAKCAELDSCLSEQLAEPVPCKPNTTFKRDGNTCVCLQNGLALCTLRAHTIEKRSPQEECTPGSSFKKDCNTCHCLPDGRVACTKRGCLDGKSKKKREIPEAPWSDHLRVKRSECKPHSEFNVDCNPCKCAANGLSYSCTHNECLEGENTNKEVEVFMENEGVDHIEQSSVCKPRATFYVSCNTCRCNFLGTDYSCTNRPCPLPADVELFHELKVQTPKPLTSNTSRVICVANRMFIKDCNTCWCNADGTSFFCTRRVCIEMSDDAEDPNQELSLRVVEKECTPNEVFEMDCNMCRCNDDGKSFSCTRRACIEIDDKNSTSRSVRQTKQEPQKTCQPGTEFRMDCNNCLCNDEGQDFSCTRIDCAALNNNGGTESRLKRDTTESIALSCDPGSVFDRDCNVCRCTSDGHHATCTLKRCQKDTDVTSTDTTESIALSCDPGSVFDRDCNVCRCTSDGHHAMCTLKRCQKDNDVTSTEPSQAFRCTPGDQFRRDCNDCTCSADGKNVFCTVRLCDEVLEEITP